jgi:hypothetical protein
LEVSGFFLGNVRDTYIFRTYNSEWAEFYFSGGDQHIKFRWCTYFFFSCTYNFFGCILPSIYAQLIKSCQKLRPYTRPKQKIARTHLQITTQHTYTF